MFVAAYKNEICIMSSIFFLLCPSKVLTEKNITYVNKMTEKFFGDSLVNNQFTQIVVAEW